MARGLTHKQKKFVQAIIEGKTQTQSALEAYDTDDKKLAGVIGAENIVKPSIVKAIAERLPDELLERRHLELLNKREYKSIEGEQIDVGPEVTAVTKALDMAYKLKGSYAPEKRTSVNVNVGTDSKNHTELDKLREEYEAKLKEQFANEA